MKTTLWLALILVAMGFPCFDAVAQSVPFTVPDYASLPVKPDSILDKINNDYAKLIPQWGNKIAGYAVTLFWELVGIDFTWTTIVWVKDRKEIGEILTGYVGKIITIGFFFLLLESASVWIPAIISSFAKIGQDAGGTGALTPDGVFNMGTTVVLDMYGAMSSLGVIDRVAVSFGVAIAAICIVISFAMIAGQLLVTLIESYIAIGAGVILLGFGGSRWTTDMATSYLKFAVGTGMKLLLCYLVIGAGLTMFTLHFPPINAASEGVVKTYIVQSLVIAGEALIFVYMAFNIPGLAAAMMAGSPNASLGGVAGAAITAGATAAALGGGAQSLVNNVAGPGTALEGAAKMGSGMVGTPGRSLNESSGKSGVQPPGGLSATSGFSGFSTSSEGHPGGLSGDLAAEDGAGSSASVDMGKSPTGSTSAAVASIPAFSPPSSGSTASESSGSSASDTGKATSSSSASDTSQSSAPGGNASSVSTPKTASVGSADPNSTLLQSINSNLAQMAQNNSAQTPSMHDKISSLQKFVPNDGASVSTPGISMGHTKD